MKILEMAGWVLTAGVFVSGAAFGAGQSAEQPKFRVEIQAEAEGGPKFTVTNLSGKTVTACYIETSVSTEKKGKSGMAWDAVLQGAAPMEPGGQLTQFLGHAVGGPVPDKVEVAAGIWADGETFGDAELVSLLINNREMREKDFGEAIALLKQGLAANWARDQYLTALDAKKNSGASYGIRRTIEANKDLGEKPKKLERLMQILLESYTQKREVLRQAKPHGEAKQGP